MAQDKQQEIKLNQKESAALDQIDSALRGKDIKPLASADAALAAGLNTEDLCKKYHEIRSYLVILVGILKKIPGFGDKAAKALEFLMSLADTVCPLNA